MIIKPIQPNRTVSLLKRLDPANIKDEDLSINITEK